MVSIASNLNLNMNIKIHSNVHYCIFLDVQEIYSETNVKIKDKRTITTFT